MKSNITLRHEFVEFVPDRLVPNILYISMTYATASHLCCCGCGSEVVTPLTPTDWCLIFDGTTVSIDPSIGNWSFPCQSHYWITRGRIRWSNPWSKDKVRLAREIDWDKKNAFYQKDTDDTPNSASPKTKTNWWLSLVQRLR